MALRAPEFPSASVGATVLAVAGLTYVFAHAAPALRNFREAGRAWEAAKASVLDAFTKLEKAQASMERAKAGGQSLGEIGPASEAVPWLRAVRSEIVECLSDLELAIAAVDLAGQRMRALRKHRAIYAQTVRGFDQHLATFERIVSDMSNIKEAHAALVRADFPAQLDAMHEIAVKAATHDMLLRAKELAKTHGRASPAEAMRSLEQIHAYATAHRLKLDG